MKRLLGATLLAPSIILGAIGTAGGLLPNDEAGVAAPLADITLAGAAADASGSVRLVLSPAPGAQGALGELLQRSGATTRRQVGNQVEVDVPAAFVATVMASPSVAVATRPAFAQEHGADLQMAGGEGLTAIGAPAWLAAGYRGAGTKLAVIDTGFGRWDEAAAAGEVPPAASVETIDRCDGGLDAKTHGTATSEVLHDVAPEASLVRVCIDDALDLAEVVGLLPGMGVNVVNMSLGFYNSGPGDGTGGPGSPDDSARRLVDAGLLWVNSAGNEAANHYGGAFLDVDDDGFHEWSGPGAAQLASFVVAPGQAAELYLRWDEWTSGAPIDDFELCLTVDPARAPTCPANQARAKGLPTAGLALTNPRSTPVTFFVAIHRRAGSGAPRLDLFVKGATSWSQPVAAGSLLEPAAARGVLAVGATCPDTGALQPTSSQGPTADGRAGVALVAPGAVSGLLFGPAEDCHSGYGGTSAAAPHVAGALALIRGYVGGDAPADVATELLARSQRAGDLGPAGIDTTYGYGELNLGPVPPFVVQDDPANGLSLARSATADRANPQPFANATVGGEIYVFLNPAFPSPRPSEVRFFVDGQLLQVERQAGYDLGGGANEVAYPFDTFRIGDGHHRLDAVVRRSDGTTVRVSAAFTVDNGGRAPTPPVATLSLAGARLALALQPGAPPVHHVLFYVDAVLVAYDGFSPYEAPGPTVAQFGPGQHMAQALIYLTNGVVATANATFTFG